jgi:hypothetical protein
MLGSSGYKDHNNYPTQNYDEFNPLKAELNAIRHLLALVGGRHIVHVSRVRVKTIHGFKKTTGIFGHVISDAVF